MDGHWMDRRAFLAGLPAGLALRRARPLAASGHRQQADGGNASLEALHAFTGVFHARDASIGIDRFITDGGDQTLLLCNYTSGLVRPMFRTGPGEFATGPNFTDRSPIAQTVRFTRNDRGTVKGLVLQPVGGAGVVASRVPTTDQDVVFQSGEVRLAGTFTAPTTPGKHPAVVLLHGSGPLTRYSFGPWPRFFSSLGLAVLVFDKRGTGGSSGTRLDASTGAPTTLSSRQYPDDLVDDALAALTFLRTRAEVDPARIGVWGSSEGGMLATQVAARSRVAFAIDSSGFMGPLWETLLYQAGALLKGRGAAPSDVDEAMAFTRLWMDVARTGRGYDQFLERRQALLDRGKPELLSYESRAFTSLEQMRWVWDHILAFSPLPALSQVKCPVLGVWGAADPLTDAPAAARAMREALTAAGHTDVTVKIFAGAGHSLMETPSRIGMAAEVFPFLRQWVQARCDRRRAAPDSWTWWSTPSLSDPV